MLFYMMIECVNVSEQFQKQMVYAIHQNLLMDVDPLILGEDRLFLVPCL
jgi:hypothetical protein